MGGLTGVFVPAPESGDYSLIVAAALEWSSYALLLLLLVCVVQVELAGSLVLWTLEVNDATLDVWLLILQSAAGRRRYFRLARGHTGNLISG